MQHHLYAQFLLDNRQRFDQPCVVYITLVRRFYPKRLTYIQYFGQSPQEQFEVKCLAQGHNDMLTAVRLKLALP